MARVPSKSRKLPVVQETIPELTRREKILRYAQSVNASLVTHMHRPDKLANVCDHIMGRSR